MDVGWHHGRMTRSITAIQRELADVQRHLVEAPPHSASGVREHLDARLDALRRELERARQSSSVPSTDTNDSISPG